jgi:hypothetical protein
LQEAARDRLVVGDEDGGHAASYLQNASSSVHKPVSAAARRS